MSKTASRIIIITVIVLAILVAAYFIFFSPAKPTGPLAPAEIPGEVVYIPYPVKIKVDGDLSDWEGVPVSQVIDGEAVDPTENGSFTFSVAADKEYFYITMQMPDKNIIGGQHGADFWNEDSFEFYVNATDDLEASQYSEGIFQINVNATDIGNTDPDSLTISGVFSTGIVVKGFVFSTEDGWGIEVATPIKGLIVPEHGKEIGFQAQINGATKLDRDVKLIWSNADTVDGSWENPYLFGSGIFFEVGREDIPEWSGAAVIPTAVPTPAPVVIPAMVSVNQLGYFTEGKKVATLDSSETSPLNWQLLDNSGAIVLEGQTNVKGEDAVSGTLVHTMDFSDYTTPGSSYKINASGLESAPFDIGNALYTPLRSDALAYFYHNRSGIPIEAQYVGEEWARPAGHETDNDVTCFKGIDSTGTDWSGCDYTLDVSGGWYDAGDFGKYVVNGGISVWTLLNLYERFPDAYPDGSFQIPENGNGVPDILDEARWEMEFLLGMQVPEGQKLSGMAHHKMHDLSWAPLPMVPPTKVENDNENQFEDSGRYLFGASTAATLNLAATGAQCARIWEEIDPTFSEQCLTAAEKAWAAALERPTMFFGNAPGTGGGNYNDDTVSDEFYWAAAELFITTGKEEYKNFLLDSDRFAESDQFDWGSTAPLGTISLAMIENDLSSEDMAKVKEAVTAFADEMLTIQAADGYSVPIKGDYPWGSNGLILNNMILISLAYDLTGNTAYLDAVRLGMDYILGHNALNKSFVTSFGEYPMEHPHHRFWASDPGAGYPPPPSGVVSGGPNFNPTEQEALDAGIMDEPPSKRYLDVIESYSTNEVTINWNAPLAWVVTYLDLISK